MKDLPIFYPIKINKITAFCGEIRGHGLDSRSLGTYILLQRNIAMQAWGGVTANPK